MPFLKSGAGQQTVTDEENEERVGIVTDDAENHGELKYSVEDVPPWHVTAIHGLQHFMVMFMSQVAAASVISDAICIHGDPVSRGQLINTILVVSGLATLLQTTIGNRLPIVQGPSASFYPAMLAIMTLPRWRCQEASTENPNITYSPVSASQHNLSIHHGNSSVIEGDKEEITWQTRMNELQGALIVAAGVQVFLGCSGLLGLMLRFVSHLVVGVVIILLSISLVYIGSTLSSGNWAAAAITAFLIVITAQYLKPVKVPVPVLSLSQKKFTIKRFPFFRAFPIFFTLFLVWLLCFLLTVSGLLDGEAGWKKAIRTDTNTYALSHTPWLRPPYPLQWGTPTFSVSAIFGMITGILAGTIDTIGDYYACAQLSGAPRPPVHAMNRAIAAEGLGNLMSALWGCGTGTTSYSANIGLIGATKVGSRRVVQAAGLWMIVFGLVGKVGALFATVPKPVIGGIYLYVVGFMMSAALSELQYVELQRSRNLFVLGFSLAIGLGIPNWIEKYPNAISTGSIPVDHILLVLFGSTIFVGGLVAMILENTLQDADKPEPPLELTPLGAATIRKTYDLPVCQRSLRTIRCMRYLPFSPSFSGFVFKKPSARLSSITESDA